MSIARFVRSLVTAGLVLAPLMVSAPAEACTCITAAADPNYKPPRWPFDYFIAQFKTAIVGTVTEVMPRKDISFDKSATRPAYVEIDVIRVLRGRERDVPRHVRIWDADFASSCEGALDGVKAGAEIVIVLEPPKTDPQILELQKLVGLDIAADEYIAPGGCITSWMALKTDDERRHYIGKRAK